VVDLARRNLGTLVHTAIIKVEMLGELDAAPHPGGSL
jgi:hypothetical protein